MDSQETEDNLSRPIPLEPEIGNGWIIEKAIIDGTLKINFTFGKLLSEEPLEAFRTEINKIDEKEYQAHNQVIEYHTVHICLKEFLEIPLPLFITLDMFKKNSSKKVILDTSRGSALEERFNSLKQTY